MLKGSEFCCCLTGAYAMAFEEKKTLKIARNKMCIDETEP